MTNRLDSVVNLEYANHVQGKIEYNVSSQSYSLQICSHATEGKTMLRRSTQ
jgi:hypothetical protein